MFSVHKQDAPAPRVSAFARRDSSHEFCETLDRTGRRHVFPFSTHSYRPVEVNKEIELHGCVFQTVIFNCV